MTTGRRTVGFTRMDQGTAEDYALLQRAAAEANEDLVEKVLSMLDQLKSVQRGYRVNRYVHSLQSATLAYDDGADEETIVAALLHDIGDSVAPDNHSALAASVLQPTCRRRRRGSCSITGSSRVTTSGITMGWTATPARPTATIRTIRTASTGTTSTTSAPSIRRSRQGRWASSNRWCGVSSAVSRGRRRASN